MGPRWCSFGDTCEPALAVGEMPRRRGRAERAWGWVAGRGRASQSDEATARKARPPLVGAKCTPRSPLQPQRRSW